MIMSFVIELFQRCEEKCMSHRLKTWQPICRLSCGSCMRCELYYTFIELAAECNERPNGQRTLAATIYNRIDQLSTNWISFDVGLFPAQRCHGDHNKNKINCNKSHSRPNAIRCSKRHSRDSRCLLAFRFCRKHSVNYAISHFNAMCHWRSFASGCRAALCCISVQCCTWEPEHTRAAIPQARSKQWNLLANWRQICWQPSKLFDLHGANGTIRNQ